MTLALAGSSPAIPATPERSLLCPGFFAPNRRRFCCIPRFCDSFDPLAQLAEQLPFKQWVRGSNPRRVTLSSRTTLVRDDFLCSASKIISHPLRRSSSPNCKRFAGLQFGFFGLIHSVQFTQKAAQFPQGKLCSFLLGFQGIRTAQSPQSGGLGLPPVQALADSAVLPTAKRRRIPGGSRLVSVICL